MATYKTAEDRYIVVNNTRFAYRSLGAESGTPLLLLMHFRGTMDHWDPALVNPLAATRPILTFDYAGVGRSGGTVLTNCAGWAADTAALVTALGIPHVDVLGFSMGGGVAQLLALNFPALVRRLVLAGTTPSTGAGVVPPPDPRFFLQLKDSTGLDQQQEAFVATMFNASKRSREAGTAAWRRIMAARTDRAEYVGAEGATAQAIGYAKFMDPAQASEGSYERLHEIRIPVLVANGSHDLLLPIENSYLLWKKLVNAEAHLHLYPDSGHGFLFQYPEHFAELVNGFLDSPSFGRSKL